LDHHQQNHSPHLPRSFFDSRKKLSVSLKAEQEMLRTNELKVQNHWRKILRAAKIESLKKDLDVLAQVSFFLFTGKGQGVKGQGAAS